MKGARKRSWDDKPDKDFVRRLHRALRQRTRQALRMADEPPIEKSNVRYGSRRSVDNK